MSVVSIKRQKGVAVQIDSYCLSCLKQIRDYLMNSSTIDTNDGFRRCFSQVARTKKQANSMHNKDDFRLLE